MAIRAETFHRKWGSASRPILVTCDDGAQWVLKGAHNQRANFNEQIVARLGAAIGAAVCEVCVAEIPRALCNIEPQLADVTAGEAHGVRYVPDCTDREGVRHTAEPGNPERFASLQLLYTWAHAGDHQLIYTLNSPHVVYSVDHGHFFPHGPNWTAATLGACPAITQLDGTFAPCGLTPQVLKTFRDRIAAVSDPAVRLLVDGPPDSWGVAAAERDAMHAFLVQRRNQLVALLDNL